jgi:isopenicillin N synthase-like dioxygenase
MPSDLPIIDLAAAGDADERRRFHAALRSAAHDVGFFQLVGHGVPLAEADQLLALSRAFFALPETDRLAISNMNSPHFRGYTRTGHELTGGSSDWRDQLDVGISCPAPGRTATSRTPWPRLVPDLPPPADSALTAYSTPFLPPA